MHIFFQKDFSIKTMLDNTMISEIIFKNIKFLKINLKNIKIK